MFTESFKMSNVKPLEQIKLDIDILSLDIDSLQDGEEKARAVRHLEETLRMLQPRERCVAGVPPTTTLMKVELTKEVPAQVIADPSKLSNIKQEVDDEILIKPPGNLYNGLTPTCTQCGDSFQSLGLLDSHMKKVHPDVSKSKYQPGPNDDVNYHCSQCDFVTRRKDNLKNHFSLHTGEFRCNICNMNLAGRVALERHKLTRCHKDRATQETGLEVAPSMTLSCKRCNFTSPRMDDLLSHSGSCHPPLCCEQCQFQAVTEYQLKIHLKSHTNNWRCEICKVTFSNERNLKRHNERIQHKTKLREHEALSTNTLNISGPLPPRGIKRERDESPAETGAHASRHHKGVKVSPSSPITDNIHEELIIDEKECGDFQDQDSARVETMFCCKDCNQGFTCKESLQYHLQHPENCQKLLMERETIKTGDLVIKPEFLGDVTDGENIQLDEVLQFQNSTTLKCEHCEESFKNVKSLRRHMISHTNRFRCQSCNLGFSERQRLERHLSNLSNCSKLIKMRDRKRRESATSNPEATNSESPEVFEGHEESEEHEQLEEEIEVFQCDQCLKYFSSKSSLKTHLVCHTDKFQCPICEKGFSQKRFLESHIKGQTNCEKSLRADEVDAREFVEAVISDEDTSSPTSWLDHKYPDIIIEAKRSTGIN